MPRRALPSLHAPDTPLAERHMWALSKQQEPALGVFCCISGSCLLCLLTNPNPMPRFRIWGRRRG